MNIITFFLIWSPTGNKPVVQHQTHEEAKTEALRLAFQWPGQEFFVLSVTGRAIVTTPDAWTPVSTSNGR